jgi:hypothetical protein
MKSLAHYLTNDKHPAVLDEEYYKDLMKQFDPNWLPHKDYSPLIPMVRYDGHKLGTMRFFVPNKYNGWQTYIRFNEWQEVLDDREYNANESARLLLWGANLRVHCGCPAYLFWGYNYILTQKDAAIIPEDRYPNIRNPNLKGIACKHLVRTLKVLPFHLGDMARAIKLQRANIDRKGS